MRKEIQELLHKGVIDNITADNILAYYDAKRSQGPNKLMLLFGVLGSTLAGLGIVLIVAHNWDNLSTLIKLILACTPLLIAQAICLFARFRKSASEYWIESSSIFLFFAVLATLSQISQIYHLPGT